MGEKVRNHILLIDINAIGYSSMYQPNLARLSYNGESTSALHGAPTAVLAALKRHINAVPFILWDGRPDWRFDIHSGYKAGRADTPEKMAIKEDYKRQADILRLIFLDMGIPQVICPTSEADDLAGHLCKHLPPDVEITLITHDTDWLQVVSKTINWESPRTKQTITLENFSETVKDGPFSDPAQYILCKAIAGDAADGIDGVSGVGLKKAKKALDKYGGLDGIFEAVDDGQASKDNLALKIAKDRELIKRNIHLMDWNYSPPISPDASIISSRIVDDEIYERFGLYRLKDSRKAFSMDALNFEVVMPMMERAMHLASYPNE